MTKNLLLCLYLLFFICLNAWSQESTTKIINQKSAGLLIENGQPYYYLPEGNLYYFIIIGGNLHIPLFKAKNAFNVSIDLLPNFGYVRVSDGSNCYEYGLNVRLGFNYMLSQKENLSFKLGCGPHYITAETCRQVNGFIFSDYVLGTYTRGLIISDRLYILEFEFGYRHVSNAGLKEPNGGISSIVVGIGFYKTF